MRRTAVHLLEKARVPISTGMRITGHKSAEVYMIYASQPLPKDITAITEEVFGALPIVYELVD